MVDALGALFLLVGLLMLLIGGVWFVIAAFQENILWGLGVVLCVPFVHLAFLILVWARARRPFYLELLGCLFMVVAVCVLKVPIPGIHHHH
jgi:hypothetical protein